MRGLVQNPKVMSTKLKQWGAVFIAYGAIALVLPAVTGMQLKIFNAFGENSTSAAIGALVIGAVMLLIGRAGESAAAPVQAAAAAPPPLPGVNASASPSICSQCGAAVAAGDRFCMGCGAPVAVAAAAPVQYTPPPVAAAQGGGLLKKGCLVFLVLIAAAVGWLFYGGNVGTYTAPPRGEPSIPRRMAGTLTEFPVDPATTGRLEPTGVITQSFEPGANVGRTPSVAAQPETFPPGISPSSIPQSATTITTATYQGTSGTAPVNIHVLQPANAGVAGQFAQGVAQSSGGKLQGTRLQSPQGQTYEGWSVRTATILVYILTNMSAGNVIIIYTPQPSGFDATQRLASSVGNGRGLRDYPQTMDTFGTLPVAPPPGYGMSNMANFTGTGLTSSLNQSLSGADPQVMKALEQVLQAVRLLIPERGTMAQYRNPQGQEKGVLVGNYGSARKAFMAYRMFSWTFGLTMKNTKAAGFDALQFGDTTGKIMVFQKGPYIGLSMVPATVPEVELSDLARSLQF